MAWLRVGDTFATDERLLEMSAPRDDRQLNEAVGFVVRCAAQSAGRNQDFVSDATATLIGGPRTATLTRVASRAGIFAERTERDGKRGWQLVNDPDFLHIRLQASIDWEAKHRALLRDPEVFLPVRMRDGDGCRYCARVVIWKDTRSARGGTLDHVIPDGDDLVVACRGCNGRKQDRSLAEAGMVLLPVPLEPYYSEHTLSVFERYGVTHLRPGTQPDPADTTTSGDLAPSRTTPGDPAPRPDTAPTRLAARGPEATKPRPETDQPGRGRPDQAPSGRDGHGAGRVRSGAPPPSHPRDGPPPAKRKRSRRGRSPSPDR